MMKENLWSKPIYLPYLQPPLTDAMVREAEQQLGYKLPRAYIEILKQQNGVYIAYKYPDYELSQHNYLDITVVP